MNRGTDPNISGGRRKFRERKKAKAAEYEEGGCIFDPQRVDDAAEHPADTPSPQDRSRLLQS
jgi:hypothetical protein